MSRNRYKTRGWALPAWTALSLLLLTTTGLAQDDKAADLGSNVYLWPIVYYRNDAPGYDYKFTMMFPAMRQTKNKSGKVNGHVANFVYSKQSDKWNAVMLPPVAGMGYEEKDGFEFFTPISWRMHGNRAVAPFFWGDDYFHVLPLALTWEGGDYVVPPLILSQVGDQRTIGPVWWGPDYFHVVPFYLSADDDYYIPPLLTWKNDHGRGVGPVWWGDGYFNLLPLIYVREKGKSVVVYPVFDKASGEYSLLPFWPVVQALGAGLNTVSAALLDDEIWDVCTNPRDNVPPALALVHKGENSFSVFPLLWQWDKNFLLLPLGAKIGEHTAVGPVFNGPDYFHVAPAFFSWDENWVAPPLLTWKTADSYGVGPVVKGKDYFYIIPAYFAEGENWYCPIALSWKYGDQHGVGPVVWGDGYRHVIPAYFSWGDRWVAPPLLVWKGENLQGVGPVIWGENEFYAIPFYLSKGDDWIAPPLMSWSVGEKHGVGPVWWGPDYFDVFPLYLSGGDDWFVPPLLTWKADHDYGAGPVFWGPEHFNIFPLLFSWSKERAKGFFSPPTMLYHDKNKKRKVTRWFWRLYYRYSDEQRSELEFNPLISYVHAKGREKNFSILWRVFQYNKKESGERYIRLLFSPKIKI